MKTMTCRALGGPCDVEHHGESADDVIKAQDRHLKEAEKGVRAEEKAEKLIADKAVRVCEKPLLAEEMGEGDAA